VGKQALLFSKKEVKNFSMPDLGLWAANAQGPAL
jgi:hypothetical protein